MAPNDCRCIAPTGATRTRYGEPPRYAEGLYELRPDTYAWMVPNGSWGESNAGLIVGEDEALLVDTLWDLPKTRQMLDAMAQVLRGRPIETVVNTHGDGDHFWGNELLPSAETIAARAAVADMCRTKPRSLVLLGRIGRLLRVVPVDDAGRVGRWFQEMVEPYDFGGVSPKPARRLFEGELELTVGGRSVRLIELGPAHTHGDLVVYLPAERLLFGGDLVFHGSTPVMWAGPARNCIAALDRLLEMEIDLVVPGHGPMTGKAGLRETRAYWEFVEAKAGELYEAGLSAKAAAREIVRSAEFAAQPFAAWDSPERMVVNVHTEFRHLAGRPKHPNLLQTLNLMRLQALLANELPDAVPHVMRERAGAPTRTEADSA